MDSLYKKQNQQSQLSPSKSEHQNYGTTDNEHLINPQICQNQDNESLSTPVDDLDKQSHPNPLVRYLDYYDKILSSLIHNKEAPFIVELILLPFAMVFNRFYCFIGGFAASLIAYYNPSITHQKKNLNGSIHSGMIYFFFMVIAVLLTLLCTQTIKKIVKRKRPQKFEIKRLFDLITMEEGTLSMPSGDTAQCTLWCGLMYFTYGGSVLFTMLLFLPVLVGFSRVFYQCHYFGDVILGGFVGLIMAYFFKLQFARYLWLIQ
ncbi:pap2 family protein [Stylonychia lemnae]|uniref:Pap2 family protein n=1 Tax=Stylonychia lemnae TaxID=5949 RepID=A0A078AY36_STYLE|nr:pap2 family protein [Stylonychia lemnae]|eukprot:CDW87079.1 pap2 family protein [Stylonychia lemnae]